MVSLKNIITHILQAHDFEVYERDGTLRAEKDGSLVTVGLFDTVTVNDIRKHAKLVSGEDGNHIICVLEANDTVEEEARRSGLLLWRKPDLEKELGSAIVNKMATPGNTPFHSLIPDEPEPERGAPVLIDFVGTEGKPLVMKSLLNLDDVKEIAKNTIHGFKYDLELVPHYLFQYSCEYIGKDGKNVRKQGTVSVNALTGKYAEWTHRPELETDTDHVNQMEPKIDEANARKIALHAVITLNTEFKEIIIEKDHATIMEKATFRPETDTIEIENQVLMLVPVWCAEGKHGVMILDGITGKIISEDYYDTH